ncbi:hypothetical protein [Falsiroseomonas ponticola]|uniref:hypothetical protein n=1 Tax=Falsiroseomonas ponticola TaxID=2786951 RepID=UPI0019323FDD|nr:hypothetical protein [Roseomonas ponticola]
MPEALIPPGKVAFFPVPTGFMDAIGLPAAGVALRPNGELVVVGGGEGFAARLAPPDMRELAALLVALADLAEAPQEDPIEAFFSSSLPAKEARQ